MSTQPVKRSHKRKAPLPSGGNHTANLPESCRDHPDCVGCEFNRRNDCRWPKKPQTLDMIDRLDEAVRRCGSVTAAARELGIDRRQAHRMLRGR